MGHGYCIPGADDGKTLETTLAGVTAAILVGGLGTRLRSVISDRPKVMASIQGRPFLSFPLDQLAGAGITNIVLCTGHLGDQIRVFFGNSYRGMRLAYSQEAKALGTAGALRLAQPLLSSNPVLVMNGDSFCDVDLEGFLAGHSARRAKATLALARVDDAARYGQVRLDAEGAVISFDEKGKNPEAGWINAGVYLIAPSLIETIPGDRPVSLEREMFPAWIDQGLYGYRHDSRFIDIGTPEAYRSSESFFTSSTRVDR